MKLLLIILMPLSLLSQTWTDPVNISFNMPGLNNQPDLCIDKNGTLHCVFTHKLDNNWRKIYYSKSTDNGITWTTPEDISLNDELSIMNPHIVADTNNNLYVTWDYNIGNPNQTMIYIKKYNGSSWEEPINITPDQPGAHSNFLVIDHNNRLYCFWGQDLPDPNTYYKYMENGSWSGTICPYPGNHYWAFTDITVDEYNNLNSIGMYHNEGQSHLEDRVIYFKYEYDTLWSDKTFLSERTAWWYGHEIDIDSQNLPHVAYRQKDPYTMGNNDDSTMYRFNNGNNWSTPELVISDPYGQCIEIDSYDHIHVVDWEKLGTGYKIVHYHKYNGIWQGYVIDETDFYLGLITLEIGNQKLYVAYYWSDEDGEGEIHFSSRDIITGIKDSTYSTLVNKYNIYPNPFISITSIEFTTEKEQQVDVSIYNLNGLKITNLMNDNIQPGDYRIQWNGKDKTGKEVTPGLYLVRLQSDRNIVTKLVEYIR